MHGNDATIFVSDDRIHVSWRPTVHLRLPADDMVGLAHTSAPAVVLTDSREAVRVVGELTQVLVRIKDPL